jgi:hypothetical protein
LLNEEYINSNINIEQTTSTIDTFGSHDEKGSFEKTVLWVKYLLLTISFFIKKVLQTRPQTAIVIYSGNKCL